MIVAVALAVGVLFAAGTFLLLQRTLTRIVLGLGMYGNAVNMLLILSGGRAGAPPFRDGTTVGELFADPMPQAMGLTTIVINFGIIAFLLAMAYRSATITGVDEVEDDLEDRRIAQTVRESELVEELDLEEVEDLGAPESEGATGVGVTSTPASVEQEDRR